MLRPSILQVAYVHDAVLLFSRLLLSGIFLHEGATLAAAPNLPTIAASLGVPTPAFIATIALQIVAGLATALGFHARIGAAALGGFCLATALLFHTGLGVRNELLHFEKDLAIAGGMFVLMLHGAGEWSVDRLRASRLSREPADVPSAARSGRPC